jgi:hypothetical protein
MRNNVIFPKRESNPLETDSFLKATALLYLRDALKAERYEECAALIQSAKEYGARPNEISKVIVEHIRELNAGQHEASQNRGRQFT